MSHTITDISSDATVNDIVRAYPATLPVFNEFGIDSCCGGGLALGIVATRHEIDLPVLLARLRAAAGKP
jgi:iron-sulfur cluster repair protein YtfE (RIC family)